MTSQNSSNENSDGIVSAATPRSSGLSRGARFTQSPMLRETFFSQLEHQSGQSYDEAPVELLFDPKTVFLTPLPSVPGAIVTKYLGPIYIHLVKDCEITRSVSPGKRVPPNSFSFYFSQKLVQ